MDMAVISAPRSRALRSTLSWLLLISLCITLSDSASPRGRPRLGVRRGNNKQRSNIFSQSLVSSSGQLSDYQTFYYDQTLDHFNYQPQSYATFLQRYVVNFKHWRGAHASAPIFVYLGAESTIDDDVGSTGFMSDNVVALGALEVYIEHRFYGKSVPFGTIEEAWKNATLRGYFSSAQAIADYAEVILSLKRNLSAEASPVIVCGGSYGGMLAAWFRLKYPHVAIGALASSAPILYFDNITPSNAYYAAVSTDFKEASVSCHNTIKRSWSEMEKVAAMPNGLSILSKKFNTCKPLEDTTELFDYLNILYSVSAQYDSPPDYKVNIVCKGIDKGSEGTDILGRIVSGIVAYKEGDKKEKCNNLSGFFSSEVLDGWDWQTCTELVQPLGCGKNDTMFYDQPFNYTDYKDYCIEKFGVVPRPHWVTTFYGGQNIKTVLKKFGSNIIFSNGLRDPYSRAGVLENISDSLVAVYTKEGSHCLDMMPSTKDDPDWLIAQRKKINETVKLWIHKYYKDMQMTSSS